MTVAIAAGAGPMPNTRTIGIKYTVAGTVCMPSKIGRNIDSNRLLSAVSTPSGTPMRMLIATDTAMSEIVTMLSGHKPTMPG